ncbi:hypothetical protein [Desulfovibrio sp. JC010]|uniref:hypothetical protein n=1 Tax=Desulfovibrio sp. JC010 TaxID=2593641 RepID=UPI0013D844F2|nr:hypothetical protein [Desulfovibrio sp. JC010]NDV28062.1 hypothetical protein [Desulfovibrio sp. JC010]
MDILKRIWGGLQFAAMFLKYIPILIAVFIAGFVDWAFWVDRAKFSGNDMADSVGLFSLYASCLIISWQIVYVLFYAGKLLLLKKGRLPCAASQNVREVCIASGIFGTFLGFFLLFEGLESGKGFSLSDGNLESITLAIGTSLTGVALAIGYDFLFERVCNFTESDIYDRILRSRGFNASMRILRKRMHLLAVNIKLIDRGLQNNDIVAPLNTSITNLGLFNERVRSATPSKDMVENIADIAQNIKLLSKDAALGELADKLASINENLITVEDINALSEALRKTTAALGAVDINVIVNISTQITTAFNNLRDGLDYLGPTADLGEAIHNLERNIHAFNESTVLQELQQRLAEINKNLISPAEVQALAAAVRAATLTFGYLDGEQLLDLRNQIQDAFARINDSLAGLEPGADLAAAVNQLEADIRHFNESALLDRTHRSLAVINDTMIDPVRIQDLNHAVGEATRALEGFGELDSSGLAQVLKDIRERIGSLVPSKEIVDDFVSIAGQIRAIADLDLATVLTELRRTAGAFADIPYGDIQQMPDRIRRIATEIEEYADALTAGAGALTVTGPLREAIDSLTGELGRIPDIISEKTLERMDEQQFPVRQEVQYVREYYSRLTELLINIQTMLAKNEELRR